MNIEEFTSKTQTPSFPLRGYIVREEGEQYWIQDTEGTWIVDQRDVVGEEKWEGELPRFSHKPVCLFLREGAKILEVTPYVIRQEGRPFTLDPVSPPLVGAESDQDNDLKNMRHLGFGGGTNMRSLRGKWTMCCWGGPARRTCKTDDCGPPIWQTF